MNQESILEMKRISKKFGETTVLNNINLQVQAGKVHVLMGENGAGKSTLMKILIGIHDEYDGEVFIKGKPVHYKNTKDALNMGIAMIHQELTYVPELSVKENIFLGKEPKKFLFTVDSKELRKKTNELLNQIGINISPDKKMADLSVSERQMIEIAKAISYNANIIIMDEPTSAISNREVKKLFQFINKLKKDGVAIIYISHKMDEIFEIGDDITVLRDGEQVGSYQIKDLDIDKLVSLMVGRDIEQIFPKVQSEFGPVALEVDGLSKEDLFRDISFQLHEGEILGFAGLMGAGRTEIMECIFGLRNPDNGVVKINGQKETIKNPKQAMKKKIGFISEDRKIHGLVLELSVKANISISNLNQCSKSSVMSQKKENTMVDEAIRNLSIKTTDREKQVKFLSGGNQQKVIFAKTLLNDMDILILDEPTRGVDIGAKAEIYQLIAELSKQKKAIILVSSEMPEILGMSHRIIVLNGGRIAGELQKEEANQEAIMKLAVSQGI